jgi:adenine specific DNA methylase Mod
MSQPKDKNEGDNMNYPPTWFKKLEFIHYLPPDDFAKKINPG